ncbi:Glycosyltransferase involved in cell wall bisynthesis [Flavobacterium flevense]|nr:Glycosyltransferase involved in cell wall bisynthesis [Flavobacterium flevense]
MVSMPSLHFFRWTSQLQGSGHEVYWFDITGMSTPVERIHWVKQKTAWKLRWNYPGRIFVKSKIPKIYHWIQSINERNTAKVFEEYLNEIKPDVVHSFALHISCKPIVEVMKRYKKVKWIYSSWGSDLYARRENINGKKVIEQVLPLIDYLFTDCNRDYEIAKQHGFQGSFLGVFPGGGGYDVKMFKLNAIPFENRKIILVKGYQGKHGKCIEVLNILALIKKDLLNYQVVVFGADNEVVTHIKEELFLYDGLDILIKERINHQEVLALMGAAKFYIGYSESDGIPNTLLEAIVAGCIPLQSNPGGATAEVITDKFNGILLELDQMKNQILEALHTIDFSKGLKFNEEVLTPKLTFDFIKTKVCIAYKEIIKV